MTKDRAEAVHRAVSRALPEAECTIRPIAGYERPAVEQRRGGRGRRSS